MKILIIVIIVVIIISILSYPQLKADWKLLKNWRRLSRDKQPLNDVIVIVVKYLVIIISILIFLIGLHLRYPSTWSWFL